jgi:hypothetical protein
VFVVGQSPQQPRAVIASNDAKSVRLSLLFRACAWNGIGSVEKSLEAARLRKNKWWWFPIST